MKSSMGSIIRVLFILNLFLILPVISYGQCLPVVAQLREKHAFAQGEKLTYILHYKFLGIRTDVGQVDVTLHNGGMLDSIPTLRAVAQGATYKFWDAFFKVRDRYESAFFATDITPFYFERDIYEGGYTIENYYHWDNETHQINASIVKKESVKDTILPGNECTFDLLTLFYHARNIDFEKLDKGKNYPVSFAIDDEIFNIYFRYIGKEVVKVPGLGKYNSMKFAAMVVAGEVFTGEEELYVWVSDDYNRIPLLFQAPIIVGSVYGRLSGWENISYPFESKVLSASEKRKEKEDGKQ